MFKAKQLDKLVKAGIISLEQKGKILDFDDTAGGGFVMKALSLLGIFTIGMGVISLVASNWEILSDKVKLFVMFIVLLGTAGGAVYYKQKGLIDKAEKLLVALFLFVGAAIGLVIQIYQLSGNNMELPFVFWWGITLPLLFVAKKKYVAWFWMPLFLVWCAMHIIKIQWFSIAEYNIEMLLCCYILLTVIGSVIAKFVPQFVAGCVLQSRAMFVAYFVLVFYMFSDIRALMISALILGATSFVYYHFKEYGKIRLNIKFAGLWVFSLYVYLGDKIGLFSTGVGLIFSGMLLIALIKGISYLSKKMKEEKANA